MNTVMSVSSGVRVVLLVLVLTFGWAVIAQAQEGPADDEYGNPAEIPAVAAADTGSASASGSGGTAAATVLPLTGGASLFALGAGVLLAGGGLIARRMMR